SCASAWWRSSRRCARAPSATPRAPGKRSTASSPRSPTRWCWTFTSRKATGSTCCARCARPRRPSPSSSSPIIRTRATGRAPSASAPAASTTSRPSSTSCARRSRRRPPRNRPSRASGAFRAPFQPPPIGRAAAHAHTGAMQRVFLVEDSASIRERLVRLFDGVPGAHVIGEAREAGEAITAILAARPDVVVLDLQLEEGSGFDVLRAVRRLEPGIAFYMLSNFASERYRRQAERLGARGFFDKTTDFERLRELIAQRAATGRESARGAAVIAIHPVEKRMPAAPKHAASCSSCNLRELCLPGALDGEDLARVDHLVYARRRLKRGEALYQAGTEFNAIYAI